MKMREPMELKDKRRVLFTFKDVRSDKEYAVEAWYGYGVVCPKLWTTNGSASYTAKLLLDGVQAGRFVLPDGWKHETREDMIAALRDAYYNLFPDRMR